MNRVTRNGVPSKLGTEVPFSSGKVVGGIVGVVVLVISFFGFGFFDGEGEPILVASFNGEIFGDAKLNNVGVYYYVDLVSDYDLFFLLEIRDSDGSAFKELCEALPGYECYLSGRIGRGISKEAIGAFVRNGIESSRLNDYVGGINPFTFERNPVYIDVVGIRYWVVHLNPRDVYREMEGLEEIVDSYNGDAVVLGDMNADCDYYSSVGYFGDDSDGPVDFSSWNWIIDDDADTTTGFKDCAYDRIIVSEGVKVGDSGVVEIDPRVSDHNLVWAEINS